VIGLSGLTKKSVYADKVLATILGVTEGDYVSYAQLSKGLHQYIKENKLKNPRPLALHSTPQVPALVPQPAASLVTNVVTQRCRDCGAEIPSGAVFCDLCGVRQ
jgi:hypothetical protein